MNVTIISVGGGAPPARKRRRLAQNLVRAPQLAILPIERTHRRSVSAEQPILPEVRERAVRMVLELEREHDSQWATIRSIAEKLADFV